MFAEPGVTTAAAAAAPGAGRGLAGVAAFTVLPPLPKGSLPKGSEPKGSLLELGADPKPNTLEEALLVVAEGALVANGSLRKNSSMQQL